MRRIIIVEEPTPVEGPPGIIYRTSPRLGTGEDGAAYYLKGPSTQLVVAEAWAYGLASLVGLAVPDCALCVVAGEVYFGSRQVRMRSGLDAVLHKGLATNQGLLAEVIAFDTWIANDDRNIGSIVFEPAPGGGVTLFAIDFERSYVLRGEGMIATGMVSPREFWPRDDLRRHCRGLDIPYDFCRRIGLLSADAIDGVAERMIWSFTDIEVPSRTDIVQHLARRARNIEHSVTEVWSHGER